MIDTDLLKFWHSFASSTVHAFAAGDSSARKRKVRSLGSIRSLRHSRSGQLGAGSSVLQRGSLISSKATARRHWKDSKSTDRPDDCR
jgi:hypothetical protein